MTLSEWTSLGLWMSMHQPAENRAISGFEASGMCIKARHCYTATDGSTRSGMQGIIGYADTNENAAITALLLRMHYA